MGFAMLGRFAREKDGVAAIEAALLFPLLILIFTAGMELLVGLEARRNVSNASFSLANAAAASKVIDGGRRNLLQNGHAAIIEGVTVSDQRAVLKGYERLQNGSFQEIWSWSIAGGSVTMTSAEINAALVGNVASGEGLVVAIVEANHVPVLQGIFPAFGTFRGFHAQVPTKTSVPIYR